MLGDVGIQGDVDMGQAFKARTWVLDREIADLPAHPDVVRIKNHQHTLIQVGQVGG